MGILLVSNVDKDLHAAKHGLVKNIVDLHSPQVLSVAAENGKLNVVKEMAKNGLDLKEASMHAAAKGHLHVVNFIMEKQPLADTVLLYGAIGKHINIVKAALANGALNVNEAMLKASSSNAKNIIELLIHYGASSFSLAFAVAIDREHNDLIEYFLNIGITDLRLGFLTAVAKHNNDLAKRLLEMGANNYNEALREASYHGNMEIISVLLDLGANDIETSFLLAKKAGNVQVSTFLKSKLPADDDSCSSDED